MIPFQIIGDASQEEIDAAEKYFIDYLEHFKEEFEQKKGTVIINFNESPTSTNRYSFTLGDDYDLGNFILRVNKYKNEKREKLNTHNT